MDQNLYQSSPSIKNAKAPQNNSLNIVCVQKNLCLPSNLLQKRKNIIQQFRKLKSTKQSKTLTPRQPETLMSKTFCHSQNVRRSNQKNRVQILIEDSVQNSKDGSPKKSSKNPLYKRISNIQSQSTDFKGVSFSKLLSRMEIIETEPKENKKKFSDYRKKAHHPIMDVRNSTISDFHCIESKLFIIQCPQIKHQSARTTPNKNRNSSASGKKDSSTNRLFKRYFNPHGEKSERMSESEGIQFDEKYIYRNGKKSQCKRIHNFYTSRMFKRNYDKHMRNTIDTLYTPEKL